MENYKINNENKDRLFKFIFGRPDKKKWLLSLYNAVNHSQYDNPDDITITTIEDAVYMSMDSCRPLSEYSQFVADMRQLYEETEDKDLAVETAVRNLPEDSEIRALLEANMAEVKMNCLTEYNDEEEKEVLKEQYLEAGADRMGALGTILLKEGRTEDLQKAFTDSAYREKLFKEFGIA